MIPLLGIYLTKMKTLIIRDTCTSKTPWTIHSMDFSRPEQPFPSPGDLPNPGIEPRSPTLQADCLPAEPQGKPKNTGVGSLSFLQWIFPTQELNWGLLHCKQLLYQMSYQGSSPMFIAALFTITKIWKQPKCPSTDNWIKRCDSIYIPYIYIEWNTKGMK